MPGLEAKKTIGVGLISVGFMGKLHARSYRLVQDRWPELNVDIKLVIAADPVHEAAQKAVDSLGFAQATGDYHDVINHPDVDVISVCSPNFLHHEIAMAVIAAGKHLWIEKPMGRNAQESREIAEACAAKGLMTAVGFNYRQAPVLSHARDLIKTGQLGEITNFRFKMMADYVSDPDGAFTWRYERALAGSGVFGDLLSHGFDLVQYLVGNIAEVVAAKDTYIKKRMKPTKAAASHFAKTTDGEMREVENEDYAQGMVRLVGGALGTFESSRIAIGPRNDYEIEVRGTKGTIRWNQERMNELQVCLANNPEYGFTTVLGSPGHGEYSRFQPGGGLAMGFDDLKSTEAMLFIKSVVTGEQVAPSVSDCWSTAEVTAAAERSIESGHWEKVTQVASGRTTSK
ncbi:MAG: hypothetical protein RL100_530 [Actinomycetota bacterium]|jgi:predicted dehydrogenase